MATIAIEGKGVIANADAVSPDTGGHGIGVWGFSGAGGVSWGLTTDTYLYGSAALAMALSNKAGWMYYDITATNTLNFTTGAEVGQHLYMWVHCPTIGLMNVAATTPGLAIRIGTSTSDYRTFTIAGSDDANGWDGRWKCFVIDPTKAGSIADTGTYVASTLRYFGVYGDAQNTAKGDNVFISQMAVAKGLRYTGVGGTSWKSMTDYCTDYPNRAWGMLQERDGIYFAFGTFWIGDSAQTGITLFVDGNRIIQFGTSEYFNNTTWVTSADIDYQGIVIEDHATFSTAYSDGTQVGTNAGRSASLFLGNSNHNVSLDLYGGNNTTSTVNFLGSGFKGITGTINFGNDADHKLFSVAFEACAQVDPVGAIKIRNSLFIATVDTDGALLWNDNINVASSLFIANSLGAAIEHTATSAEADPYTYTSLTFSGNTYDILNNTTGSVFISAVDSNPANATNPLGGDTYISNDVFLTVNVENAAGDPIASARVRIETTAGTELMNEKTTAGGQAQESYNYLADKNISIRIRRSNSALGARYVPIDTSGQISSGGFSLTAVMQQDNIAN